MQRLNADVLRELLRAGYMVVMVVMLRFSRRVVSVFGLLVCLGCLGLLVCLGCLGLLVCLGVLLTWLMRSRVRECRRWVGR